MGRPLTRALGATCADATLGLLTTNPAKTNPVKRAAGTIRFNRIPILLGDLGFRRSRSGTQLSAFHWTRGGLFWGPATGLARLSTSATMAGLNAETACGVYKAGGRCGVTKETGESVEATRVKNKDPGNR